MKVLLFSIALFVSLNTLPHKSVFAGEPLLVASAANFILPLEELTQAYNQTHDLSFTLSYGSSGKLYAQLLHGAPYDMFLSADKKRPALLHEQGLCEAPFKYATGRVVLWSAKQKKSTKTTWQGMLTQSHGKIAITNIETAPYGEIPYRSMQQQDMLNTLQSRLVFGQTVGQTFLFTRSGAALYGFIALSQALSTEGLKGDYWPMPESDPIEQWGCIPLSATNIEESNRLRDFLLGQNAQAIIRNHGYQ